MAFKIPLSKPYVGDDEKQALNDVLDSSILSLGPRTEQFEEQFCSLTGRKFGVAVNSGTAGLHLAVKALGLRKGDEVITSPFSFIASANCMVYEGVKPVFVDIEEDTFGLDVKKVKNALTEKVNGVLPVHVFGSPNRDMAEIVSLSKENHLKVIEDACESVFAKYQGKPVGSFGDASVFGFYPNKQITTGEGGMVLMDDERVYQEIKSLRNQGRSNMQVMEFTRLGYNYRMSELTAALGISQLKKANEIVAMRKAAAQYYLEILRDVEEVTLPVELTGIEHSWFVFVVRVDEKKRDRMLAWLDQQGIQSKPYFDPCIHLQPYYRKEYGYKEGDFPVAEQISKEAIALPFFTQITREEIHQVVETLKTALVKE